MIKTVRLYNFRNYGQETLAFQPGVNAVIGSNGRGKTNLLEALFFMLYRKSFRTNDAREMIRKGESGALVEGVIHAGRDVTIRLAIEENGSVKGARATEEVRAVSFQPDDVWMVKGGPEERRRALDEVLLSMGKVYGETIREYQRVLRQRNEAIKEVRKKGRGRETIRHWNPLLVDRGRMIVQDRQRILADLEREMTSQSEEWDKGKVELRYYSTMGDGEAGAERALEKLLKLEEAEIRRGATLVGPHRDELIILLGGRNTRRECSQGEQKLTVLLWKLAQARILARDKGKGIVLLMDDCLSELDAENRRIVADELAGWSQVMLTATEDQEELRGFAAIRLD